ncbi:MAG TPA: glycosyl hydrolase family 28-related protein, partial [Williamwhitmania sp.]|nr:glycosyl hydrolase family 28-related protein [Williamwhitmania sp.]
MTKFLTPTPKFTVYNNGIPANGAKVYVYAAGTTTPADSYSDEAGTPNTNPVICDSRGECDVWLTPGTSYKFVVKDSADATIYTVDDIASVIDSSNINFLQAGTGAVTRTVQSKERDVISVKDFGATGDGVTDDTAAIQAAIDAAVALTSSIVTFPPGTYIT